MAAVGVVERAHVATRGERRLNLVAGHVAHAAVLEPLLQLLELAPQLPVVAGLHRRQHVAVDPIAVDVVARDELPHQREPFDGDVPDRARGRTADEPLQLALARGHPVDCLGAAAAGGAPADPVLLQQHHGIAALGEMQRRRAAGDAAADHADVAFHGPASAARSGSGRAEAA